MVIVVHGACGRDCGICHAVGCCYLGSISYLVRPLYIF